MKNLITVTALIALGVMVWWTSLMADLTTMTRQVEMDLTGATGVIRDLATPETTSP